MKILVADDHTIVRRGIKEIITEEFPDATIIEASDSRALLAYAREGDADLIVTDLSMPGKNAIEVLKDLRAAEITTPVIVLSMHPAEQYAVRVLKAGGSAYLTKETAPEELVKAIRMIQSGKKYINETVSDLLVKQIKHTDDKQPHERLSDREFTVFKMIASGKTTGEIARELNLGIPTVSTYRIRIMEKFGLKNNAEIMRYALEKGLA